MRQLSKSKIIAYRQCPKRLWLELHRPELRDDTGSEAVFAIGNQVGEVARRIYDPGGNGLLIDVDAIGWDAAFERTGRWLNEEREPLFEAALRINGALALADVMLPDPDGDSWRMIEVKSSGSVKDYQRDDLAVQTYIADNGGVKLSSASIAHVDTSVVYPGGGDYRGLLVESDLTAEVRLAAPAVAGWVAGAQQVTALPSEPTVATGAQCCDPFECPFRHYCDRGKPQVEYPLTSFYRLEADKRQELETLGYTDLREVPDEHLSDTNRFIKEQTVAGVPWFDGEGAAADLEPHSGTAYFLDFETIAFAVPVWVGTRPYRQLPFQFSLHVQPEEGELEHREFLDLSGDDPVEILAEALVDSCGAEGPVFVYNAGFERRIIRETAGRVPRLSPQLLAINARIVDLLPIARNRYYHPDQHGSWSIKAVLPCICPDLDYSQLDGVADGSMAQTAYLEAVAPKTSPERRNEIRRQLLEYCKLDTLAMVRLWQFFKG